LKSVDFPTFGRPTIATVGIAAAVAERVSVELYTGWLNWSLCPWIRASGRWKTGYFAL